MTEDDLPIEIYSQTGPWAMVPWWVLHMGLSASELATYVALRTYAGRTGQAWPRVSALAIRAGVSRSTAHRALARLRELDLVRSRTNRRPDGSVTGLRYWLRDVPPSNVRLNLQDLTVTLSSDLPECHSDTGGVSPGDTGGVSPADTQNTPENTSGNINPLLTADAASAAPASPAALKQEFNTWWPHYPRKVGRKAALVAYAKARREATAEQLLAAVQAYEVDPNQPVDRSKIPHPATWLNGGRWDDEPLPAPVSTATQRVAVAATLYEKAAALDAEDRKRVEAKRQLAMAGRL